MSKKSFGPADAARITIVAVRAAYGDYTAAAVEGASILARSSKIIITIIMGFLMLFTVMVASLEKLIPGFEELYGIYRTVHPSATSGLYYSSGSTSEPAISNISSIYFPIPAGNPEDFSNSYGADRYTDGQKRSHEGIDIFAARNTPLIAVEDAKIIKIGWNSLGGWRILLESLDGNRRYYYAHLEKYGESLEKYRDMTGAVASPETVVHAGDVLGYVGTSGSFVSDAGPGADTGTPPHLHFQLWLRQKDKYILTNPYHFLKLIEAHKYSLPATE